MPSSPRPPLNDSQLDIVMRHAEPLHPHDRGAYLKAVSAALRGQPEIGDGLLARICREAFESTREAAIAAFRKCWERRRPGGRRRSA
jgi:hypothetical protein